MRGLEMGNGFVCHAPCTLLTSRFWSFLCPALLHTAVGVDFEANNQDQVHAFSSLCIRGGRGAGIDNLIPRVFDT